MAPKYKVEPIEFAKLVPKPQKIAKPVATSPQTCCMDSNEVKPPDQKDSELRELLRNTEPRNIPQRVKERFEPLSKHAIIKMIQGVSKTLESADEADKRILEVTLKALQELLQEKNTA